MSQLEKLVRDIGYEVEKLTSKIGHEREKIKDFEQQISLLTKDNDEKIKVNSELRNDLKELEGTLFRENQQCSNLELANDIIARRCAALEKTIDDVKKADLSLRTERQNFISTYKNKLENFEDALSNSHILKNFLELWKSKVAINEQLIELPDVVIELSKSLTSHTNPELIDNLKELARESQEDYNCEKNDTQNDSEMESSDLINAGITDISNTSGFSPSERFNDCNDVQENSEPTSIQFNAPEPKFIKPVESIKRIPLPTNPDMSRLSETCLEAGTEGLFGGDTILEFHNSAIETANETENETLTTSGQDLTSY